MKSKDETVLYEGKGKLIDAAIGETKNGVPRVELLFEYEDGFEGQQKVYSHNYLNGGALEHTLRRLRSMGWQDDDRTANLPTIERDVEYKIRVVEEEYNGKTYVKVSRVWPLNGDRGLKKVTDVEAKDIWSRALPPADKADKNEDLPF